MSSTALTSHSWHQATGSSCKYVSTHCLSGLSGVFQWTAFAFKYCRSRITYHDLRPFGRKPCIAGGNFGGMGIHLYNFCSSAREAYPSTASPPKPNPTRRRSPRSLDCHATPVVPSYQPVLRIRRLVSRMVQPLGYDPASFPYEYGYFSIKICSTRSKK